MIKKQNSLDFVIINQNSGYLMIDIANALHEKYTSLFLISGRLIERNNKLHSSITRINTIAYLRNSNITRILTWSLAGLHILLLLKTKFRKAEILFVTNPPIAPLLSIFAKNTFSVLIYDIYPDVLVDSGIISEKSFIARKWVGANKRVFSKAKYVYTISEGLKNKISTYSNRKDIHVIPIWTDSSFLKPISKTKNPFIHKYGLSEKFIILYSGNLGHTHNPEVILKIAKLVNRKNIVFVIIGDGDKKAKLIEIVKREKIQNCLFLPFQDASTLPYSISSADIAIVTTAKEASNLSIPSKTYDLMSVGAPILGIAENDSELAHLIDEHKIGKHFISSNLYGMLSYIEELSTDKKKHQYYKRNSINASTKFTPENAKLFLTDV